MGVKGGGKRSVWVEDGTPTEEMESYVFIYTLDYIKKDAKLCCCWHTSMRQVS